jgi:hypothetical protein
VEIVQEDDDEAVVTAYELREAIFELPRVQNASGVTVVVERHD